MFADPAGLSPGPNDRLELFSSSSVTGWENPVFWSEGKAVYRLAIDLTSLMIPTSPGSLHYLSLALQGEEGTIGATAALASAGGPGSIGTDEAWAYSSFGNLLRPASSQGMGLPYLADRVTTVPSPSALAALGCAFLFSARRRR